MVHKIILELPDQDFKTLASYVQKHHRDISVEEYITNTILFYLRIGSCSFVHCPYGCEEPRITQKQITSTLLKGFTGEPDPNIYSTEYFCEKCKRRFWVSRQFGKEEVYVKEKEKE